MRRYIFGVLACSTLFAFCCSLGCKTVESNAVIDKAALKSATSFSYSDWKDVVTQYVNDTGQVDYTALKQNRTKLDQFVATIAVVGPKMRPDLFQSKNQRLAYYINAYNALTMFNVLNRYPIKSVNDEQLNFFVQTKFPLDGAEINLYDLENKIVRPEFKDPRVHFALNCASGGCPVLPAEVFEPETLEAQLDRETQKFLHEPRNVSVENGSLVLSEILKWYAEDFPPSPMAWVKQNAPDIEIPEGASVTHRPYDWALNDQKQ